MKDLDYDRESSAYDWKGADICAITGKKGIMGIRFSESEYKLSTVLGALGLPDDYEWVVWNPELGKGYVIILEIYNTPSGLFEKFPKAFRLEWEVPIVLPSESKFFKNNVFPVKRPKGIHYKTLIQVLNAILPLSNGYEYYQHRRRQEYLKEHREEIRERLKGQVKAGLFLLFLFILALLLYINTDKENRQIPFLLLVWSICGIGIFIKYTFFD